MGDDSYDVIVVGCGIAGLSAAVSAHAGGRAGGSPGARAEGGARRQHPLHRVVLAHAEPRCGLRGFRGPLRRERGRPPRPCGDRGQRQALRRVAEAPARPRLRRPRTGHHACRQRRADAALAHELRRRVRLPAQLLHHREHDPHSARRRRPRAGGGARGTRRGRAGSYRHPLRDDGAGASPRTTTAG